MPEKAAPLTQSEADLLAQICRLAERRALNGVYTAQLVSSSVGAPVFLLVALGEQALAVQAIIMQAAVPDEQTLIERVSATPDGQNFLSDKP